MEINALVSLVTTIMDLLFVKFVINNAQLVWNNPISAPHAISVIPIGLIKAIFISVPAISDFTMPKIIFVEVTNY